MVVAIDETGDFKPNSIRYNFFTAVHIRQHNFLYKTKKDQFKTWETSLPKSLKDHKGEIKSNKLPDEYLEKFITEIILSKPWKIGRAHV